MGDRVTINDAPVTSCMRFPSCDCKPMILNELADSAGVINYDRIDIFQIIYIFRVLRIRILQPFVDFHQSMNLLSLHHYSSFARISSEMRVLSYDHEHIRRIYDVSRRIIQAFPGSST